MGVDKKAIAGGHLSMTRVCDLLAKMIEYAGEGRKAENLEMFYQTLSPEQRSGIQAVSMALWNPFFQIPLRLTPGASGKIVFDRFPIMGHVGKAAESDRKKEAREERASDLNGSKYLGLYSKENLQDSWRSRPEALRALNLKERRAEIMKEEHRSLWHASSLEEAQAF